MNDDLLKALTEPSDFEAFLHSGEREVEEPRALARRDQNFLHEAADANFHKLRVAVMYAFAAGRQAVDRIELQAAITAKDFHRTEQALAAAPMTVRLALESTLPKALLSAVEAGGEAGMEMLGKRLRVAESNLRTAAITTRISFDKTNPNVTKWAKKHATELAKNLSLTSRQEIAEALVEAFEGGNLDTLYDVALQQVGSPARAEMIARTESMRAANAGQRESWDQAVEKGLLPADIKREWIATSDACPFCVALDGKTASLSGEYPNDGGEGPPLHPDCRCTEGISAEEVG